MSKFKLLGKFYEPNHSFESPERAAEWELSWQRHERLEGARLVVDDNDQVVKFIAPKPVEKGNGWKKR